MKLHKKNRNSCKKCSFFRLAAFFFLSMLSLLRATGYNQLETVYYTFLSSKKPMTTVEIYFKVYNTQLQFIHEQNKFSASLQANLTIQNTNQKTIEHLSIDQKLDALNYAETVSHNIYHIFRFIILLKPGDYTGTITVYDQHTGQELKSKLVLEIPDYHSDKLKMSSLQLSTRKDTSLIQSVNHTFSFLNPEMTIYYETYAIDSTQLNSIIDTRYSVFDDKNNVIYEFKKEIAITTTNPGFFLTLSTENFRPGEYRLVVEQNFGGQRENTCTSTFFHVVQSPIDLRFKDFEQAVEELQYIVSKDELATLSATAQPDQQEVLREFWKRRDPQKRSANNLLMYEYYSRITKANRYFSTEFTKGWQTDFGFIYVLFGQPQSVRHYQDPATPVRMVWEYNHLGLEFTFISRYNDSFTLLHRNQIYSNYLP